MFCLLRDPPGGCILTGWNPPGLDGGKGATGKGAQQLERGGGGGNVTGRGKEDRLKKVAVGQWASGQCRYPNIMNVCKGVRVCLCAVCGWHIDCFGSPKMNNAWVLTANSRASLWPPLAASCR